MTSNRNRLQLPPLSRREALRLGLAGLAAGGVAGFPTTSVLAQQNLQWGSSSIGSTGYVIMEGLAKTVNSHSDLQHASMATSGGTEKDRKRGVEGKRVLLRVDIGGTRFLK